MSEQQIVQLPEQLIAKGLDWAMGQRIAQLEEENKQLKAKASGAPSSDRPSAVLGIPCTSSVPTPFLDSILMAMRDWRIRLWPITVPNTTIHLARDELITTVRDQVKDANFLIMVDSDQIFGIQTIARLMAWNAPVVAPVIVQRMGDPIPVQYNEVRQNADTGVWEYESMSGPLAAYLHRYNPEGWQPFGVQSLPVEPDFPDRIMPGTPDDVVRGLDMPLYPVDAVGAGMVCIRRDVLESMEKDKKGRWVSFDDGGEDFDLCRRIRAAGWGGSKPGSRGPGIFVDRGNTIGHLTYYTRGVDDFLNMLERRNAEKDETAGPVVPNMLSTLAEQNGHTPTSPSKWPETQWQETPLPVGV